MTNWEKLIERAMESRGESLGDIESSTLDEAGMAKEFDDGYGGHEGEPFTVWTQNSVYFPVVYDGAEWVGSVARHPDGKPTPHCGGE